MIKLTVQQLGVSPELAMAMFDTILEQQELIERGERCEMCGELHLPEDLEQGLCDECLMELAVVIAEEIEKAIMETIEEEIRREEEEMRQLEEVAEMLKLIALLSDDHPIDMRLF